MNHFPQIIDENIPGLQKFWWAPVSYFSSIDDPVNYIISSINFVQGKNWFNGWSLNRLLLPEEKPKYTDHGDIYHNALSGKVPKDTPSIVDLFVEIRSYRHIVVYQDNNGYYKLLGSLDSPCIFEFKLLKNNDSNEYHFSFRSISTKPLYFLSTIDFPSVSKSASLSSS